MAEQNQDVRSNVRILHLRVKEHVATVVAVA